MKRWPYCFNLYLGTCSFSNQKGEKSKRIKIEKEKQIHTLLLKLNVESLNSSCPKIKLGRFVISSTACVWLICIIGFHYGVILNRFPPSPCLSTRGLHSPSREICVSTPVLREFKRRNELDFAFCPSMSFDPLGVVGVPVILWYINRKTGRFAGIHPTIITAHISVLRQ